MLELLRLSFMVKPYHGFSGVANPNLHLRYQALSSPYNLYGFGTHCGLWGGKSADQE